MKSDTTMAKIAITVMLLALALPAAASDYTLDIFGNANEDDTVNMQDVTYTELIILEYRDETELADGKYDGKINMQDVTQIELTILGKEKELTILDSADRTVTISMPVERIASASMVDDTRRICALGAADKIVAVPGYIVDTLEMYPAIAMTHPELAELPIAGSPYYGAPNLEIIASLEPDLVLVCFADADAVQEATGVPTIATPSTDLEALAFKGFKWLKMMGYILGEQDRAEELISYYNEKLDEARDVTSDISDDEKPKVYLAFWGELTYTPAFYGPVEVAGGINVAEEGAQGPYGPVMWVVSKEQIIAWNPDVILLHGFMAGTLTIEDVLSDPDLQSVSAVQSESVYFTKGFMCGWDPATGVIEASCYMPKLFHPEEFADLDVEEAGNEILDEVYGADGIWTAMSDMCCIYRWE